MKSFSFNLTVYTDKEITEDKLHGQIMAWLQEQGHTPVVTHEPEQPKEKPKKKDKSLKLFMASLEKRYRYIHDMLVKTNPDLPRWIYDNLVKEQ